VSHRSSTARRVRAALVAAFAMLAACQLAPASGGDAAGVDPTDARAAGATGARQAPIEPTPADTAARPPHDRSRSIVTWNLQWFLDPERGPSDDARQLEGARAALVALAPDLLAVQELSSEAALIALLQGTALRAAAITAFEWPQQLAIACSERLQPLDSRVLDALSSAGRAPLEVELEDRVTGARLIAIAVHAKAYADAGSHRERRELADGLHAHVQARWPDRAVIVLGDFNDGLTRSIVEGEPSPYAVFVADPRWATPTAALERADAQRAWLDHVIVSDELAASLGPDSAARLPLSTLGVELSAASVSDHVAVRVVMSALHP
jgi:endonuclease/exonuclease/phosphatase family metal-dependent hydrolase